MEFKDYYATLGLQKGASDADIKRAYRKLARQHHPDLNPGDKAAETRFKEINEANEVLGDADKRRKYDELGANWRAYENAQPGGGGSWSAGAGATGGYRTMTPDEMREMFGGGGASSADDPFSDFFHTFFGGASFGGARTRGRAGRASRERARGQDAEAPVELTFDEAFRGTTRRLVTRDADGKERQVEVRIPAGVRDNARVRVAGEGGAGANGGDAGDLYLAVRVRPHAQFERRENDLYTKVPLSAAVAVLGGEAEVPVPAGGTVRLKVPALTSAGRMFRVRGHGMPVAGRAGERGDLYATADIELPKELTEEERVHWTALRAIEDARRK